MPSAPPVGWGFSPLDKSLGLLPWLSLTPRTLDGLARLGAQMPFARAAEFLAHFTGVRVSPATARRQTLAAGAALVGAETAAAAWILAEAPAPSAPAMSHQVVSVDGAMVPLRGEWAEVKTVAIGEVRTNQQGEPRARELSYFSRLSDCDTFIRLATVETHRRSTELAADITAVVDGAEWLQEFISSHCPRATRIIDWGHASSYVSEAGRAVLGDTPDLLEWRQQQWQTLRTGDPQDVLSALATLGSLAPAESDAQRTVAASLAYLAKRQEQIQYARFIGEGRPIGSGCVESANKLVVEARLKGSGMRWQRQNVDPLLALRNALCSQRWDATWAVLHPYRCAQAGEQSRRQRLIRHPSRPPRTKTPKVVAGRPAKDHPWRRFRLRHRPRDPKP